MTQMATEEIVDEKVSTGEPGDHDKFSHYVNKKNMNEYYLNGGSVTAICGKEWQPNADPMKFPVCPDCKGIYEMMHGG